MTKPAQRDQLTTRTDKVKIGLTEEGLDQVVGGGKYLSYELQSVFVSSYNTSSAGGAPTER